MFSVNIVLNESCHIFLQSFESPIARVIPYDFKNVKEMQPT